MADKQVRIRITGGGDIIKQLEGAAGAADKLTAAEKRAAKEAEKLAKEQIKASQKAAAEAEKAAKHAEKVKTAEARKAAAELKRIAEKEAAETKRLQDREIAEHARYQRKLTEQHRAEAVKRHQLEQQSIAARSVEARRTWRKVGGFVGAGVMGAVAGGASAANTARGIVGVQDLPTRIQNANEMKQSLILTAADAGLTPQERAAAEANVNKAAMGSATAPSDLVAGLGEAHSRFNSFRMFNDNLPQLSKIAKAQDTSFPDFVTALGSVQNAFGLQSEQLVEAANIMIAASEKGSLNFKQFATAMAPQMGTFAANTGQTDIEGLRQFVGVMQTAATRQGGAEDASVRGSQAITYLNRPETAAALTDIGVQIRGADGKIDVGSVIEQLATNKDFQTPMQQASIFKDAQAREGIQTLIMQRNKALSDPNVVDYAGMTRVDAGAGAANTTNKLAALEESGLMGLQRQAVDMQVHVNENLKDYNDQLLAVTKMTNEFERAMGTTVSLWGRDVGIGGATSMISSAVMAKVFADKSGSAGDLAGKLGEAGKQADGFGKAAGLASNGLLLFGVGLAAFEVTEWLDSKTAITDEKTGEEDTFTTWLGKKMSFMEDYHREVVFGMDGKAGDIGANADRLKVDVEVHDKRTEAKVTSKSSSKADTVSTGRGMLLPNSGF